MKIPSALGACQVARIAFDHQTRISFTALDPNESHRVDAELIIENTVPASRCRWRMV